jgi:hypothetical protein
MNPILSGFIIAVPIVILTILVCKAIKLPEGWTNIISFCSAFLFPYFFGEQIMSFIGLNDGEIRLTEMVKPVKVYSKLEVSDFKLTKLEISKKKESKYEENKYTYMIGYTIKIKNVGDPIIAIDDPNGTANVGFGEHLILRKLDGVDGKEDYTNFGGGGSTDLLDLNGNEINYSTTNPIKTNETFTCISKIEIDKDDLNTLFSRKYEAYLYIHLYGTTKDKYKEPNGYGFIIKQDEYKIDLTNFLFENSDLIKSILK